MKNLEWSEQSHSILEQAAGLDRYNHWLMGNFKQYFGRTILEIGSGQGALSKLFPGKAIIILSDIYSDYINKLKQTFTDPVLKLDIENEAPEILIGKMDTIFSSNVFEHIKDDKKAFLNCFKLLESGGRLLLFVPARPEIYGKLDTDMGHYRRYTHKSLKEKVEKAGFKIEKIHYVNLPGYFLWWGRGVLIGKLSRSKPGANKQDNYFGKLFDKFIVPLLYLEKYLRPPIGQSLVLIARKSGK